jgi:hypothetical protein
LDQVKVVVVVRADQQATTCLKGKVVPTVAVLAHQILLQKPVVYSLEQTVLAATAVLYA